LPEQGPIRVFIHHNPLHAFEHVLFDRAVQHHATKIFGCEPYLSLERYRSLLAKGRFELADVQAALREDLGILGDEPILGLGTRYAIRLAMLQYDIPHAPLPELRWHMAETDALRRYRGDASPDMRRRVLEETRHWVLRDVLHHCGGSAPGKPDALYETAAGLARFIDARPPDEWPKAVWETYVLHLLWRICREGVRCALPAASSPAVGIRHRDVLLAASGQDSDRLVHGVLVPFCAAYLDQGQAARPLPLREHGFWHAFCALYTLPAGPADRWRRGLRRELLRLKRAGLSPLESIRESLELLGVPESEWGEFLSATLLALRGWAGMLRQVEARSDSVAHPVAANGVQEYLAVRLILERLALPFLARRALRYRGPLDRLRPWLRRRVPRQDREQARAQAALCVFHLAQLLGWPPQRLYQLDAAEWATLVAELEAFPPVRRREIMHRAFERRYYTQILDAVALRAARGGEAPPPQWQLICCIDERAESLRRHVEETCPTVETFGAAGFFAVPIYYRGAADAHYVPLCPIVIKPQHWVAEEVVYPLEAAHRRRSRLRRMLGRLAGRVHRDSRSFALGALLAVSLGVWATLPLVARVLFPRLTGRLRRLFGRLVQPPPLTQLHLERLRDPPAAREGHLGFTVTEMAAAVERLLRDIGLIRGFAPLVLVLGHGSTSLNNPHESAHDCGACGGGRGGPNARSFARMANDPRVRALLAQRGLLIPDSTHFVGGLHNTCDDSVLYFDLEHLPPAHKAVFTQARTALDEARQRDAHERCRRFESAPLDLTFEAALRHVEARADDLSQVRPEYGHATNAVCVVGRRARTRGLFLDRRAFLTSYDPTQDDEHGTVLARVLRAVVPVCAGINLEYYFGFTDPTGWGSGTKLPHNVTSLLGVMDGAASDLRPGLPWQMLEIHEPVRLLFIVETTPEIMSGILDRHPEIGRVFHKMWAHLAVLSPSAPRLQLFQKGRFVPYRPTAGRLPTAASSLSWYRGWRDHLQPALIEPVQD
jgi:uncharacterized protein YbcC (UPF0753/DUF2309 family)